MREEPLLPGLRWHRLEPDLLFWAVKPDAAATAAAASLGRRFCAQHRTATPLKPDHYHITLHAVDPSAIAPPALLRMADEAGSLLQTPSFRVTLDRTRSFERKHGNHPWVLSGGSGLDALRAFHQSLWCALRITGVRLPSPQRFTPHLTLAYGHDFIPEQKVGPVEWTVSEFVLIRSLVGRGQHVVLGKWAFRG